MVEVYDVLVYLLAYIGFLATSYYILSILTYYRKKPEYGEKTDRNVAIIIPAYNEEKSIARTIKSALALDYPKEKLEIIVVDDGSKDRTLQIAKEFESASHPRIRVLTKPNGGKGSALNLGIKSTNSEIIVSMDADSFIKRDALKKMIAYFHSDKVVAVTPSMGVYKPQTVWQRVQHIEYYMGVFLRKSFATVNAIHITPGAFSAYRKSFFDKYGGYDEKNITEDLEIALRIQSKHLVIENSPKAVVYTMAPRTFRELLVQRRRWYSGFIRNFWHYRSLFGFKHGPLGTLVLPVALATVVLSVVLTMYMVVRAINHVRDEIFMLHAINFRFEDAFELNMFILREFFYRVFSYPVFLLGIIFLLLLTFYMYFSQRQMKYKEPISLNFILFAMGYGFIFAFWWILSAFYVLFNRKVVWRENKDGS